MAPELAKFRDEIVQEHGALQARGGGLHARRQGEASRRSSASTWRRYTSLVRHGAKPDDASKQRMKDINERLAKLYTVFSQNVPPTRRTTAS